VAGDAGQAMRRRSQRNEIWTVVKTFLDTCQVRSGPARGAEIQWVRTRTVRAAQSRQETAVTDVAHLADQTRVDGEVRLPDGVRVASGDRVADEVRGVETNRERISRRQVDKFAERRAQLADAALQTLAELGLSEGASPQTSNDAALPPLHVTAQLAPGVMVALGLDDRQADINSAPVAAATNIVTIRIIPTDCLIRWVARQDSAAGLDCR